MSKRRDKKTYFFGGKFSQRTPGGALAPLNPTPVPALHAQPGFSITNSGSGGTKWKPFASSYFTADPPPCDPEILKQVRGEFSMHDLRICCKAKTDTLLDLMPNQFGAAGTRHATHTGDSKILAVAHCDYVELPNVFAADPEMGVVFSPRLDDRLGVYTLLYLLPSLGINLDVLLTENEERGATTAKDFITDKKYNWVVSFDRRGEDVVYYQYSNIREHLTPFFAVGHGSYSDIAALQHLGVLAFNVGVGYESEHTSNCTCQLKTYFAQIARFVAFYRKNSETHLVNTCANDTPIGRGAYSGGASPMASYWRSSYYDDNNDDPRLPQIIPGVPVTPVAPLVGAAALTPPPTEAESKEGTPAAPPVARISDSRRCFACNSLFQENELRLSYLGNWYHESCLDVLMPMCADCRTRDDANQVWDLEGHTRTGDDELLCTTCFNKRLDALERQGIRLCPYCGMDISAEDLADGGQCPSCGSLLDPEEPTEEVTDAECPHCAHPVKRKNEDSRCPDCNGMILGERQGVMV
jgi:hypothetical protein